MNQSLVSTITTGLHILIVAFVIALVLHQMGVERIVIRRILAGVSFATIGLVVVFGRFIPSLPYKVGNTIEVADFLGTVEATTFLNTRLKTLDGKTVFIPNRMIFNDTVVNFNFTPERQIKLSFDIRHDADLLKAKTILWEVLAEDPRILANPAARVLVLDLNGDSVQIGARPWVENADYWKTRCDLIEKIKFHFDQEGIPFARPQRDVHIYLNPGTPGGAEAVDRLTKSMAGSGRQQNGIEPQMEGV